MTVQTATKVASERKRRRRRRVHRLTRSDRVVIGLMIGVPLLLDLAFIWGPAIATVFLSFTDAHSVAPVKWVGGAN